MVTGREEEKSLSRRRLLLSSMGVSVGLATASFFSAVVGLDPKLKISPSNRPPQKGDFLVFAQGQREGHVIRVEDIPEAGPQIMAWPMDPESQIIRKENHLNIALLVRAREENWLSPPVSGYAFERVVAFAATCTHLCCTVSDWISQPFGGDPHGYLSCPCHRSHFDPWNGGKVLFGPAPRPLPILPLAGSNGNLIIAAGFLTEPGCSAG